VSFLNSGERALEKRLSKYQGQIRRLEIKWTAVYQSDLKGKDAGNEANVWRINCEAGNIAAKMHELENLCKEHLKLIEEKEDKVHTANKKKKIKSFFSNRNWRPRRTLILYESFNFNPPRKVLSRATKTLLLL